MGNRTPVEAHYEAAAHGDLDGMTADFADDIVWVEAAGFPLAGAYRGRDEIAQRVFAALTAEWDGFGMIPERFVEQDGTVVAIGRYIGTHRATGKALDARAVHIWKVEGDAIVGFEQIMDTALVAAARTQEDEA